MASDPTLDFLARLDDPTQWVVVKNVPVFRPHKRTVKQADGTDQTVEVTEADMPRIAAKYQRLEKEFGVIPRMTLGHTLLDPQTPERKQPPIVGYGRNLRVGTFGPAKAVAVLADCYYRRDCWEEAKEYPYRSAEYYSNSKEITGIALLKRDPQLDMGMVTYRRGESPYYLYMGDDAKMDDKANPAGEGSPVDPPDAAQEKLTPEEEKMADKFMRHYSRKFPAMQQFMAAPAPACPSGTNGGPPAPGRQDMGRQDSPVLNARVQALENQLRETQSQYVRAECERELERLESTGYQLDKAQEAAAMLPMTPEQRSARLKYIQQFYRQAPVGNSFLPVPVFADGRPNAQGKATFSDAEADKAIHYMAMHPDLCGDDFDAALVAVRAGNK